MSFCSKKVLNFGRVITVILIRVETHYFSSAVPCWNVSSTNCLLTARWLVWLNFQQGVGLQANIQVRVISRNLTSLWKITILNGKMHYDWPFSLLIAMLNYQRVPIRVPFHFQVELSEKRVPKHVMVYHHIPIKWPFATCTTFSNKPKWGFPAAKSHMFSDFMQNHPT